MRSVLLAIALVQLALAQSDLWQHVRTHPTPPHVENIVISQDEQQSIAALLKRDSMVWTCNFDDPAGEWLKGLRLEPFPLSLRHKVVLVEAGPGCARGGQGANGAMWLIRLDDDKPTLLAGPSQQFNGWVYSVQPTSSGGYKDVVLGWHISAQEASLSYFRFDGKRYKLVSGATLRDDDLGHADIIPGAVLKSN